MAVFVAFSLVLFYPLKIFCIDTFGLFPIPLRIVRAMTNVFTSQKLFFEILQIQPFQICLLSIFQLFVYTFRKTICCIKSMLYSLYGSGIFYCSYTASLIEKYQQNTIDCFKRDCFIQLLISSRYLSHQCKKRRAQNEFSLTHLIPPLNLLFHERESRERQVHLNILIGIGKNGGRGIEEERE